ncbi:MAG: MBL fold metallo-hydrolase [bacterium]
MLRTNKIYSLVILFLIVLSVLVWSGYFFETNTTSDARVYFLSVGQGDSSLIVWPGGRLTLIDVGPDSSVVSQLKLVLPFYRKDIDLVILTHLDADHIGGLDSLLSLYSVHEVWLPEYGSADKFTKMEKLLTDKKLTYKKVVMGDYLTSGGANLRVLSPYKDKIFSDDNDEAVATKFSFGQEDFLFMSDLSQKAENFLLGRFGNILPSEVLKVGHHGSKNSSGDGFIEKVAPEYSILSFGEGNKYGHPNIEAVNILKHWSQNIVNTLAGPVWFETDGSRIVIK